MKILFLDIDTESDWAVASVGPAYLAAYVRSHGHEADFLRATLDLPVGDVVERVGRADPQLIGVSLTTRQWQRARKILAELRRALEIPVVAGGLHPTFSPEEVLSHPGIDYACLGEGEAPLLDLIEALAAGRPPVDREIDNIWANGGQRPQMRPPLEPIDALPFMARDLLDERHGVVHMATQRGCPFPCTYCGARMFNELYAGNGTYGRRRSHESVIAELRTIREAGPLNYVIFLDDTFTINHHWVAEFCEVYGRDLAVPFSLHARVETVNEKMVHALAAAGCRHIVYGVESGSPRVRREIMRRSATNQRFIDVFRWTREAGIMVTANYILGIPGETRQEMQETIDLHHQLQPEDFGYFVFYPYPGTALFATCRDQGYLPNDYLDRPANHRETILALPGITQSDISEFYDRWTDIRVADTLRRYGDPDAAATQAAVAADANSLAASG